VTQSSNRGCEVFFTDEDRQQYLVWLAHYAAQHGLKVWAYCLMTNHVHLICVPEAPDSLGRVMRPLQMLQAQRVNADRGFRGHLWADRYFTCALDEAHLWHAVRYVERNPVRARLVRSAEAYPWSSAPAHCGLRPDPVLSPDLPLIDHIDDWAEWLHGWDDEAHLDQIRRRTRSGRPWGTDAFAESIGIPPRRPPGRPRTGAAKTRDGG
jgi:putative transposase